MSRRMWVVLAALVLVVGLGCSDNYTAKEIQCKDGSWQTLKGKKFNTACFGHGGSKTKRGEYVTR